MVELIHKPVRNSDFAIPRISHGSVEVLRASPHSEESDLTARESYTLGRP